MSGVEGYSVDSDELADHAEKVRDQVGSKVGDAAKAAQYDPGVTDMGVLGFLVSKFIEVKKDTETTLENVKEFGDDLADSVESARQSYKKLEDEHVAAITEIGQIEAEEERRENPPGPKVM